MKSQILKLQKRVLNNSKGEVDNKENARGVRVDGKALRDRPGWSVCIEMLNG